MLHQLWEWFVMLVDLCGMEGVAGSSVETVLRLIDCESANETRRGGEYRLAWLLLTPWQDLREW